MSASGVGTGVNNSAAVQGAESAASQTLTADSVAGIQGDTQMSADQISIQAEQQSIGVGAGAYKANSAEVAQF